jgi:small subunit ribosomal protein S16
MPAKIRLARHGKKSRPFYFIVVADSRAPRDGKFIERIGSYNPVTNPATIDIDFDKALTWLQKGALPTDTVRSLLLQRGILYKNHLLKGVKKGALTEEQVEQKFQEWVVLNEQKLKSASSKQDSDKRSDDKSRLAAETKIKEARAAALAKKNAKEAAAAQAEEEPIQVTLAKPDVEAAEEATPAEEAPVAEAPVVEAPVVEAVAEVAAEEAPEAPEAEAAAEEKPAEE